MRVLWFSITPAGYDPRSNGYNGGGWIASLESVVKHELPIIELAVAFEYPDGDEKHVVDGVTYYTIAQSKRSIFHKANNQAKIKRYLDIVDDFKPDIIQIFGSENAFGELCGNTDVPIVIHIQGCLPPYNNAFYPQAMNRYDFIFSSGLPWRRRLMGWLAGKSFGKSAEREVRTIQACHYFMGRTDWDRRLVDLFNPDAKYFHCEEALRDSFINNGKQWDGPYDGHQKIVSVISGPWYKGVDVILKTAKLLRQFTDLDFEWQVYGVKDIHFFEKKYGIKADDVNVRPMGIASKDQLVTVLCQASCFVHPSYIENSPNSVCEPQYLGLPVIATNVGGVGSIVRDGETGRLVPANAPYELASHIKELIHDNDEAKRLGSNARNFSIKRHDPRTIAATLMEVYNAIIDDEK